MAVVFYNGYLNGEYFTRGDNNKNSDNRDNDAEEAHQGKQLQANFCLALPYVTNLTVQKGAHLGEYQYGTDRTVSQTKALDLYAGASYGSSGRFVGLHD
eukprot:scaffold1064_cov85-Amphora_coffeaeformis.AAC.23